jgi:polyisoprenoid-binding protein YceI
MSWHSDPANAHITFTVRHLMISNVWGLCEKFDGVMAFDEQHLH